MFALGPLVFWATAEMACGFFIICVPCMPKILQQTGVLRRIKRALGMPTGGPTGDSGGAAGGYRVGGGSGGARSRGPGGSSISGTGPDSYYKLEEDGGIAAGAVAMGDLKASESTEHLRDNPGKPAGTAPVPVAAATITRTTHIAVTEDSRSTSDGGSSNHDMHLYKQKVPWAGYK